MNWPSPEAHLLQFSGEAALLRLREFLGPQRRLYFEPTRYAGGSIALSTAEVGRLRVTRFATDFDLEFTNEAQVDCVHFQFIDSGVIEYGAKRGGILGGGKSGELMTASIHAGDRHIVRTNADRVGLSIHQSRVGEIANQHFGIVPPRAINFCGVIPIGTGALTELRGIIGALLAADGEHPERLDEARKVYETAVLVSLLVSVPSNVSDLLLRSETVSPAYVIRAQDFMKARFADSITIEEIAEASRCTPRNLQLTFRRVLGTSPMRYLRKLRLEEARRRLLAGDEEPLTSMAMSLGYSNLGRFAKDYQSAFGSLPSHFRRAQVASADATIGADKRDSSRDLLLKLK